MTKKTTLSKEVSRLQKSIIELQEEVRTIRHKSLAKTSIFTKTIKILNKILTFFANLSALLIPAISIYFAFSNFVSIPPSRSVLENAPLRVPFIVKNESFVNLKNVKIVVDLINVDGETDFINKEITLTNSKINININETLSELKANSSHTLYFNTGKLNFTMVRKADIQIHVFYEVLFFKKHFHQKFRFAALENKDGYYEYYPIQTNP